MMRSDDQSPARQFRYLPTRCFHACREFTQAARQEIIDGESSTRAFTLITSRQASACQLIIRLAAPIIS